MPNVTQLAPEEQFPSQAVTQSVIDQPTPENAHLGAFSLVFQLASTADMIEAWGSNVEKRDRQLRDFWPTEPYLAGGLVNVSFRNSSFGWSIRAGSKSVEQAVTDMLTTAIAGDAIGWIPFIQKLSQDLYAQDNGGFIEIIRDPTMDATSKFKGPMAPVIGIAHLDSNRCMRTGNTETPVYYQDRQSIWHKLKWYQVIPLSDFPSPIETMNGVGVCAVSRALRLAQIMKSIEVFKDEKIGGRNVKDINIVSGVSRTDLDDAVKRTQEQANNKGYTRFIDHAVLASLDPEKQVSSTTISLADFPDGFNFDQEMQWYISGLALDFGVDYQEFAPLPGGNIGSGSQSVMLHKKTSGKGPAVFINTIMQSFKNYGVLPRNAEIIFNDLNEQEELEKQEVRTKALEEMAIAVRGGIIPPDAARKILVKRGIYREDEIANIPEEYGLDIVTPTRNPVGQKGGNTIAEDAARMDTGRQDQTVGDRLRKFFRG